MKRKRKRAECGDADSAKLQGGERAPVTLTCKEAAKRHQGVTAKKFQKMCLQGEWLRSHYRGGRIPAQEMQKALFAKKVGRDWHIPKSELDRMFMAPLT